MKSTIKENQRQNQENKIEIDIADLFRILWQRFPVLIIGIVATAAVFFLVTYFLVPPTYRSSFSAYVNNHTNTTDTQTLTSGDTVAAQSLTYTYAEIMESRTVITKALKEAGLNYSYKDIEENVSTDVEADTQIVILHVTMKDPNEAEKLAKAIALVSPSYVEEIVDGSSMKIVDEPELPDEVYSPDIVKATVIGGAIGLILAMIFIFVSYARDTSIKSERELENISGLLVLGLIPSFDTKDDESKSQIMRLRL